MDSGTLSVSKVVAKPADLRGPSASYLMEELWFSVFCPRGRGRFSVTGLAASAPGLHVYSFSCVELLTATSGRTPVARGGSPRVKKSRRDPENSPSTPSLSPERTESIFGDRQNPLEFRQKPSGLNLRTLD